MTLQTHEEQEMLARVRRCEASVDILVALCMEILQALRSQTKENARADEIPSVADDNVKKGKSK